MQYLDGGEPNRPSEHVPVGQCVPRNLLRWAELVRVHFLTFGAAADQTDPWLDHFSYVAIKRVSCSSLDQ